MKIVMASSSARKNGNTEQIVKLLEDKLLEVSTDRNIPLEVEQISLCRKRIEFCRGCRVCFDKGENFCPISDDVMKIKEQIESADGIVLASPVYVEDINGPIKNWIDRMAYNCHRPAFYGKCAAILTTSGAGSSNHALNTMKLALNTWGIHMVCQNKFRMGARMEAQQIETQYGFSIKAIADKLFDAIQGNKALRPSLYSLISFNIQQRHYRKRQDLKHSIDTAYWRDKGWLDTHINYYLPPECSRVKILAAKIIGHIMSRYFI